MTPTTTETCLDRVSLWLATGLGIGLGAPAPGTLGSLWGLPLAYGVSLIDRPALQLAACLALVLVAVRVAGRAARVLVGSKDPQAIVIDEFAVLPIVYLGVGMLDWKNLLAGWLLFRLFDITKPAPCKRAEKPPGGWGIVADDVVAAVYACFALHVILWLDTFLGTNWLTMTVN